MTSACGHDHADPAGLSGPALAHELDAARQACEQRGERLTPTRARALELLLQASAPVKAYDLMAAFAPDAGQTKPPTVYRALEFLARQGLAHRIESLNAYVACRHEGGHRAAFLICDCCGAAQEFDPGDDQGLDAASQGKGFKVESVILEAHGLCADCQGRPSA